jgi:hypothetical protein
MLGVLHLVSIAEVWISHLTQVVFVIWNSEKIKYLNST